MPWFIYFKEVETEVKKRKQRTSKLKPEKQFKDELKSEDGSETEEVTHKC